MFGWLKRKTPTDNGASGQVTNRDIALAERLMRAYGEGQEIAKLRRALATLGDVSFIFDKANEKDFVICGQAAAMVIKAASKDLQPEELDEDDDYRFCAGVWALALSNQISHRIGAPFEEAGLVACVELLGISVTSEIEVYINGYNSMNRSGRVIEAISKTFTLWLQEPIQDNFQRLTDLFRITLDNVREIDG
jgi:hypothetical protein